MRTLSYIFSFIFISSILLVSSSLFTVHESEKALVTRFKRLKSAEYIPNVMVVKNEAELYDLAPIWIKERRNFFQKNNSLLFILNKENNQIYTYTNAKVVKTINDFVEGADTTVISKEVNQIIEKNNSKQYGVLDLTKEEKEKLILSLRNSGVNTNASLVYSPGLHYKIPFIEKAHKFDSRLQTLGIPSSDNILTKGKKAVHVDMYVQWKIDDFEKYFLRVSSQFRAEELLRQKVISSALTQFGKKTLQEAVSGQRGELTVDIERGISIADLGIKIEDVKLKKLDLPDKVSNSIYERMRTERSTKAKQYRADGEFEAEKIKAEADKDKRLILAKAQRESEIIRGEGDSESIKIYAKTYEKDPEFFKFQRTLEAYKKTFKEKSDFLVLKPDNEFFKYFSEKS